MQKWLMSNLTGLVAAAALTCTLVAGVVVTIAQVRCTLLEEDVARLKSRLADEIAAARAEQATGHKAVLALVNETARRVATQQEDAKETEETPAGDAPKAAPGGGFQ
jgi:hypothetical protein